jgi:2-methylcitrate dehydratase PrpD
VRRPDVQQLMKRVHVSVPDDFKHHRGQWGEGVNWGEMRLKIRLQDGRTLSTARSHARGWPEQPASWADIEEKYRACCDGILSAAHIDESVAAIKALDTAKDVKTLLALLRP